MSSMPGRGFSPRTCGTNFRYELFTLKILDSGKYISTYDGY
jgi:hypothetical protein